MAVTALLAAAAALAAERPAAAASQGGCARVVVFTLPATTWYDVEEFAPPEILAAASDGASGSVAVRTNAVRTSYAAGYATLGAGARAEGDPTTGGAAGGAGGRGPLERDVVAGGFSAVVDDARDAGYGAAPGALASALDTPVVALGNSDLGAGLPPVARLGRWVLLAAADRGGTVELAATGPELLARDDAAPYGVRTDRAAFGRALDAALRLPCATVVVDPGDLVRADHLADVRDAALTGARRAALLAADDLLRDVRAQLDPARDLLLVVSPTSPDWLPNPHLGVALALGPRFPAGSALESASTRRPGIVTLPDVAPTVLRHHGAARPPAMNGRPWIAVTDGGDPLAAALALDREATLVDGVKPVLVIAFIVGQIALYAVAVWVLAWRPRPLAPRLRARLQVAALAVVATPVSAYVTGMVELHPFGWLAYVALIALVCAALTWLAWRAGRTPLERLLAALAPTAAIVVADLVTGAHLQFNSVFGYSPIVAGRFSGAGNHAFAVLGTTTILVAGLVAQRRSGRIPLDRATLALVTVLFVVALAVDGMPQFGSDVGGVIAFVPALAITWVLMAGRRPSARVVVLSLVGVVAALAAFLALDLARPPEARTHLARLYEDVSERGAGVLGDTIERKAESNVRLLRSSTWTLLVPPALAAFALLAARPRAAWTELGRRRPVVRAAFVGALLLAAFGFAVNDSGIGIPGMVLSFLAPAALMARLELAGGHDAG
ncbi:MAG TPA: hypothetical protein VHJ34_05125 [Actinomycetota bacterium]|nr:hypothetical protein [Actinomycetota bacterium]